MKKFLKNLLLSLVLISCAQKKEKTKPTLENITESVYASGILKSNNQYQVFSPVNGILLNMLVSEGDTVKAGETLFTVNNETAGLNVDNAALAATNAGEERNMDKLNELQTAINQAFIKMKNDSLLLQKQKNLWEQEIGTRNELEQRELAFRTSTYAYSAALSRLSDLQKQIRFMTAQARNNLQISKTIASDYSVKSKINGRVYSIIKEPGEMLNTQTPVAVIGGVGNFIIELQIDEYDIEKIKPGQKVVLTMDSQKDKSFEAVITRIIPFMNERTRSFTAEAAFTDIKPTLYPNLTLEANIIMQEKENVITIPRNYLLNDSMVLKGKNEKVKVVTGLKDYRKVEILKGLQVSDVIIKPGQ